MNINLSNHIPIQKSNYLDTPFNQLTKQSTVSNPFYFFLLLDMYVGIILPRDMDKTLEDDFVYALGLFASLKISESTQIVNLEQRKRTSHRIASFLIKST